MTNHFTLGQYIPGKSFLHKADPRIKIILALIYVMMVMFLNTFLALTVLFALTAIIYAVARIPVAFVLRSLRPLWIMILLTLVIKLITEDGTPIINLGFLIITREGVFSSIFLTIRLFLFIAGMSIITLTTTPIILTDGIEKIMSPLKKFHVPVHEMAMMMTIAMRFIPILMDEIEKIKKAQLSRGADFECKNLIKRAKSYIPIFVPLFISTFRRANDLAEAMESRCYRGDISRTKMRQLKIRKNDAIISLVMVISVVLLLVIENYKYI